MPDDRPESPECWHGIAGCDCKSRLSTPAGPSPEAITERRGDGLFRSTGAAPSPREEPWTDPALFPHLNHPAPREEAVEAAAKAVAATGYTYRPEHVAQVAIDTYLSAARPSSPTPEAVPSSVLDYLDSYSDETVRMFADRANRSFIEQHRVALALAVALRNRSATPGDDATTKEGR